MKKYKLVMDSGVTVCEGELPEIIPDIIKCNNEFFTLRSSSINRSVVVYDEGIVIDVTKTGTYESPNSQ